MSVPVSVQSLVSDAVTLWTGALQAPLSVGFPRREYWSGVPFPAPGDLPNPGIEPKFSASQADSLPLNHEGSPASVSRCEESRPRRDHPEIAFIFEWRSSSSLKNFLDIFKVLFFSPVLLLGCPTPFPLQSIPAASPSASASRIKPPHRLPATRGRGGHGEVEVRLARLATQFYLPRCQR